MGGGREGGPQSSDVEQTLATPTYVLLRKGGVREGKVEKSEMLKVVGEEEGAGKRVGGRDHM